MSYVDGPGIQLMHITLFLWTVFVSMVIVWPRTAISNLGSDSAYANHPSWHFTSRASNTWIDLRVSWKHNGGSGASLSREKLSPLGNRCRDEPMIRNKLLIGRYFGRYNWAPSTSSCPVWVGNESYYEKCEIYRHKFPIKSGIHPLTDCCGRRHRLSGPHLSEVMMLYPAALHQEVAGSYPVWPAGRRPQ